MISNFILVAHVPCRGGMVPRKQAGRSGLWFISKSKNMMMIQKWLLKTFWQVIVIQNHALLYFFMFKTLCF